MNCASCAGDFTCPALVHGIAGRLSMGVIVHKVRLLRLLLLAVVLCVLSGLLLVTQSEENRQYVWSIGTQASSQKIPMEDIC